MAIVDNKCEEQKRHGEATRRETHLDFRRSERSWTIQSGRVTVFALDSSSFGLIIVETEARRRSPEMRVSGERGELSSFLSLTFLYFV